MFRDGSCGVLSFNSLAEEEEEEEEEEGGPRQE